jgi:hypothetical protein
MLGVGGVLVTVGYTFFIFWAEGEGAKSCRRARGGKRGERALERALPRSLRSVAAGVWGRRKRRRLDRKE